MIQKKQKKIGKKITAQSEDLTIHSIWGWMLVLLGAYFLLGNAFGIRVNEVLSGALIVFGIIILFKRRQV